MELDGSRKGTEMPSVWVKITPYLVGLRDQIGIPNFTCIGIYQCICYIFQVFGISLN